MNQYFQPPLLGLQSRFSRQTTHNYSRVTVVVCPLNRAALLNIVEGFSGRFDYLYGHHDTLAEGTDAMISGSSRGVGVCSHEDHAQCTATSTSRYTETSGRYHTKMARNDTSSCPISIGNKLTAEEISKVPKNEKLKSRPKIEHQVQVQAARIYILSTKYQAHTITAASKSEPITRETRVPAARE